MPDLPAPGPAAEPGAEADAGAGAGGAGAGGAGAGGAGAGAAAAGGSAAAVVGPAVVAGTPDGSPTGRGAGAGPAGTSAADASVDLGRRSFFRRVAGDLVQTAASLTGVSTVAQSAVAGAAAAARELGVDGGAAAGAAASIPTTPAGPTMEQLARQHLGGDVGPWTWDGERLLLLDQRRLPATAAAFPVASAGEAARAIGERVVAGPAAAIVAAWGLALSADAAAGHGEATRVALIAGAERSLRSADPASHVLRRAIDELSDAIRVGLGPRATAGRLETRMLADHRAVAARVASLLDELGAVAPLLHGPSGALWGGGAGTALDGTLTPRSALTATAAPGDPAMDPALDSAAAADPAVVMDPAVAIDPAAAADPARPVRVTEGRPWLDGARVTAWELARHGVPVTILTDAAAPGAILRHEVDVVLCAAERVAIDGSVSLPVGALALALAADRAHVPFVVAAAPWSVDATAADGAALVEPPQPATLTAVSRFTSTLIAPPEARMDGTRFDVVPSALVTHLVTLP